MATNRVFKLSSAATTNATSIKVGTGVVFSVSVTANTTTPYFVKLYDLGAAPTVGTDKPEWSASSGAVIGASTVYDFGPGGIRHDNGIALAITLNGVQTDNTAAVLDAVKVIVNYR